MKINFTTNTITINGKSFPAEYSISAKTGDVYIFTIAKDKKADLPIRMHFEKTHPLYEKAIAAAKAETVSSAKVEKEPVKAEPVKAEPVKAEPVKAEPVKAEPVKAEPVKVYNWRIMYDEENARTRIIFDGEPSKKQFEIVTAAGFYYSKVMNSYNKKLTNKAKRAAEEVAAKLSAL